MAKESFDPKGKTFSQRLEAFLTDSKTTYKITISQDSGRSIAWQVKHHVAHMFLYNRYKSTKPANSDTKKRTISWLHFSDPKITWATIKQDDFLRTKNDKTPVKADGAWKEGSEPDEEKTIAHVKSIQKNGGIGDGGKAMVSAGLEPCGEPCKCGAGRSKHLDGVAADLSTVGLSQLTAALTKAKAGTLDGYLKKFGLHRPLVSHPKSPEPWHVEATK